MSKEEQLVAEIAALETRYDNLMECYNLLLDMGLPTEQLPHPWPDNGERALREVIGYLTYREKQRLQEAKMETRSGKDIVDMLRAKTTTKH